MLASVAGGSLRNDLRPRLDDVHALAVGRDRALDVLRLPAARVLDGQAGLRQLRQQPKPVGLVVDERVVGVVLISRERGIDRIVKHDRNKDKNKLREVVDEGVVAADSSV